ncbi:unnamed protein product [Rhodiola kirilowii]
MALTLRPSASFIHLKESRTFKSLEDVPSLISFAQTKRSFYSQSKISTQESKLLHEKTFSFDGEQNKRLEILHVPSVIHGKNDSKVPVFVMLPLDTVTFGGHLHKPRAMNASLMALKSAGVEGVMVDVWWGLVEKEGPCKYNWEGYAELVQMVQRHGLKLQMVMSFHQCGGNVGDSCSIPLPPWVLEEVSRNPDLVYTDRSGRRNPEYISLGCDAMPLLRGRTPIQVYGDYMRSFRNRFKEYLGGVIMEIQVGLGPCGELRYPAYPESNGTWKFPGIGEFQCYDKYMRASLQASADAIGKGDWGGSGPHDAGNYNQFPDDTGFFRKDGTWTTEYGQFFLEWYSGMLLDHGERILSAAEGIFLGTGTKLSGKVAGIHWHYNSRSHAAELTAGYYNTRNHDGYTAIAQLMGRHGVILNFTCMEMRDHEQPQHANCSPEGLNQQVKMATKSAGTELAGENALERYDSGGYAQVIATSRADSGNRLSAFTYLRLNKKLLEGDNWRNMVEFVRDMTEEGRNRGLSESDRTGTNLHVRFVVVKMAAAQNEIVLV